MKFITFLIFVFPTILISQSIIEENSFATFKSNQLIDLKDNPASQRMFFNQYAKQLGLNNGSEMKYTKTWESNSNFLRHKYQQTYKGIPVLGATYTLHAKNGKILKSTGKLYPYININSLPRLSFNQAKLLAQEVLANDWINTGKFNALKLPEIQVSPTHRLVVMDHLFPAFSGHYLLCYEVEVLANTFPPIKEKMYIDAHSGKLVNQFSDIILHKVEGEAETYYYGKQNITIDSISPDEFLLHDHSRGDGVFTYNAETFPDTVYYSNDSKQWAAKENYQDLVAADAHYCSISFYDLMNDKFGWNGLDGQGKALIANVNANGRFYVNAFWNGTSTNYGNGDCDRYNPLTTLDVVGHEYAHGFTQFTSGLVYRAESGAINEGMSDIFGKALEYYYDRENFNWRIGDRFRKEESVNFFRSMDNPNLRNHPKYFQGIYWSAGGAVHTNSGLLNHWFYLMVEGGQGINEVDQPFAVNAVGWEKALDIVFDLQIGYLNNSSNYLEAMYFSLEAAADLYGANSAEYKTVLDAWFAVGLYPGFDDYDLSAINLSPILSVCPDEAKAIEVEIVNSGKVDIPVNSLISLTYNIPTLDDVVESFNLPTTLAVGESFIYEFERKLLSEELTSNYLMNITLTIDDLYQLNNSTRISVYKLTSIKADLSISNSRIQSYNDCGEEITHRTFFTLKNEGCETIIDNTPFKVKIKADNLFFEIEDNLPYPLIAGSSVSRNYFYDLDELPIGELSFELIFEDGNEENNQFEDANFNTVISISNGYKEDFESGEISSAYAINRSSYRIINEVENLNGNNVLAFYPKSFHSFYRSCDNLEDFFNTATRSSMTFCVDADGMEEPIFSFDLFQHLADVRLGPFDFGSVMQVSINGEKGPLIENNNNQFNLYEYNLPSNFQGEIVLEFMTLFGAQEVEPGYANVDAALIDNIELKDVFDPRKYEDNGFAIYPNPSNGLLTIQNRDEEQVYQIIIFDNLGRKVLKRHDFLTKATLDINNFASGIYFVQLIKDGEKVLTRKVVKE